MFNLDSLYMFILPKPQYAFTTGSEPIQLYYTVRERNIIYPVGKVCQHRVDIEYQVQDYYSSNNYNSIGVVNNE